MTRWFGERELATKWKKEKTKKWRQKKNVCHYDRAVREKVVLGFCHQGNRPVKRCFEALSRRRPIFLWGEERTTQVRKKILCVLYMFTFVNNNGVCYATLVQTKRHRVCMWSVCDFIFSQLPNIKSKSSLSCFPSYLICYWKQIYFEPPRLPYNMASGLATEAGKNGSV